MHGTHVIVRDAEKLEPVVDVERGRHARPDALPAVLAPAVVCSALGLDILGVRPRHWVLVLRAWHVRLRVRLLLLLLLLL